MAWIDVDPHKIGNRVEGTSVVDANWLTRSRPFVLNFVAGHGSRDIIASRLGAVGYRCGLDYLMVG